MWLPEGGNVVNCSQGAEGRGDCTCVLQGPSTEVRRSVLDLLDLTSSFTYISEAGLLSTYLTFSKVGMVLPSSLTLNVTLT